MAASGFTALLLLQLAIMAAATNGCDRTPDMVIGQKSNPEGKFRISMSASPLVYVPGEMYTIKLNSSSKFLWFSLWVEAAHGNLGNLHLFSDAFTKYSETCSSTITASSFSPKTEIQALWNAPVSGSGCISFKAAVVEQPEVWYLEDGPLTYTICEDLQEMSGEKQLTKCCACDEAKYEVSFEGLWSRQTHPKDFPEGENTRFSDVIGASHTSEYRFWVYGGTASEGLREVAELGSTRTLESELKSQSQHIRTIIKARGIAYPNVTGKTFAVFRVDSRHHLISLVSMIMPSPDWIVGVSGLELCLTNCTWVETYVRNLYPWDAGTDSGVTYLSPDNKTEPKDRIRRITAAFPSDPNSPFYSSSGELKPLARLYLTRQRLYEKSCSGAIPENPEACDTTPWGEWSPCSETCGTGEKTRQRWYRNKQAAKENNCDVELTLRSPCSINIHCSVDYSSEDNSPSNNSPRWPQQRNEVMSEGDVSELCKATEWSEWSGCSVRCGKGQKHRFRRMLDKRNWKECTFFYNLQLQQTEPCNGTKCGEPIPEVPLRSEPVSSRNCSLDEWADWSPCSLTCGEGVRVRHRRTYGNDCQPEDGEEKEPCFDKKECVFTSEEAKEICVLPKPSGPCRGSFEKYYFNTETASCTKFISSGCPDSLNQFDKLEDCEKSCAPVKEIMAQNRAEKSDESENKTALFNNISPAAFIFDPTLKTITGYDGPVVDCRVSSWSKWERCSVTCGEGYKRKTRRIIQNARNGGRACPRRLLKTRKCNEAPCYPGENLNQLSDYEDDSQQTDDCVYSEWTPWTHCTPSCGLNSIQRRSRTVRNHQHSQRSLCADRVETRVCNVLPCIH